MKTEIRNHTIVITGDESDYDVLLNHLSEQVRTFEKYNIVVDLLSFGELPVEKVKLMMPIAKEHTSSNHSFVLVGSTDFNKVSSKLMVVPSLAEAYDLIEMDEIERDLGF